MKIAIVGCGGIGRAHALAWQQVPDATLAYAVDRDPSRAQALADETGAAPLLSLDDLPPDAHVASLTTDPASHGPLAEACLRRGLHVFCEKPLGMTAAESRQLIQTSQETGRALSVGFKMRYEPIFAQARELCPQVGPIVQIATTKMQPFQERPNDWRPRVGAMIELSVHDFDLIGFITGLQWKRVVAAQLSHRLGWEREDGFTALVEWSHGAMAALSGCYTTDSTWQGADFCLTVTGERGYMRVLRGDRIVLHTDEYHVIEPAPPGNTFVQELRDFADAVASGAPPPIPAEAGYEATALIEAIWEAGQ